MWIILVVVILAMLLLHILRKWGFIRRRRSRVSIEVPGKTLRPAAQPVADDHYPYPSSFLKLMFDKKTQMETDRYIGTWDNAGVIYDRDFVDREKKKIGTLREPASYTPYIQDYVHIVDRPMLQPFPTY